MNRKRRYLIVSVLVVLFLILGGSLGSAQEPTTVTLPFLNLPPGASSIVEGEIDCVGEGCSAFAVTISFDPQVLRVTSAEVGPYLGGDFFEVENDIDNTTGQVRLAAVALGDLPDTEANVLFVLEITVLAEGGTVLEMSDLEIGDLVGNPVEVTAVDGAVTVTPGSGGEEVDANPVTEETEEPESTGEPEITDPCTVRTDEEEVRIRVGPGFRRGIRGDMPVNVDVPVVGQFEDSGDNLWWKIQPEGYDEREPDRYWVAEVDVEESGDCEGVGESEPSVYVPVQVSTATPEPAIPATVGDVSPAGPVCGNGVCEAGEDSGSCRGDCGAPPPSCGNGSCNSGENCSSCPNDCGACTPVPPVCGDGYCNGDENCDTCTSDCGACYCITQGQCCKSLGGGQYERCNYWYCPVPDYYYSEGCYSIGTTICMLVDPPCP